MHFGGAMFFTDYSMSAMELARALEGARVRVGLGTRALAYPASRKTPFPRGGDLPKSTTTRWTRSWCWPRPPGDQDDRTRHRRAAWCAAGRDPDRQAGRLDRPGSQGRFLFGVGGGWNQDEMENHGTVYATRFKRMRERSRR